MANTIILRRDVEDHVRKQLQEKYGIVFSSQVLRLRTGGEHEFDAVSADQTIVASIKSSSGLTSGNNIPDGKIKNSIAELYYLSLVEATLRLLVLTTPSFYQLFTSRMADKVAEGIQIELIPLTQELQKLVNEVVAQASKEVSPEKKEQAVAVEIENEAEESGQFPH